MFLLCKHKVGESLLCFDALPAKPRRGEEKEEREKERETAGIFSS